MKDIKTNNIVEHIEMTRNTEKDNLTFSRLPGDVVHIVCKDGDEFLGFVWIFIDTGENGNSMPYILLEKDFDGMSVELYANDIEYIDVICSETGIRKLFTS